MPFLMTYKRKRQARLAAAAHGGGNSGTTGDGVIYGLRFGSQSTVNAVTCEHASVGAVLCPECAAAAGLADTANPSEPVVAATRTPQPTQGDNHTMAQRLVIRPVPDSIIEGRKIRAAKAAGTYNPTEELPSVIAHRQQTLDQANARRAEAARLEVARMRDYKVPDSLENARRLRAARNAVLRESGFPKV